MNAFEKMIVDVFSVPQFRQYFYVDESNSIPCISYQIDTDTQYTQFGYDQGVSLHLTCKAVDYSPKKGNKITFRNKQYKIDSFVLDSFGLTYKILLKDLTSK